MEGTRPILVELQALVVPSGLGTPRRAVVGWDANRLAMLLAVLDARAGISFVQHDVYLNVAGGLKITEPAADLAAAAALLSSISNVALGPHEVYFGEISLSGAVRPAGHMASRLKEARKLGFKRAILPAAGDLDDAASKLDLIPPCPLKGLADVFRPSQDGASGVTASQDAGIPAPPATREHLFVRRQPRAFLTRRPEMRDTMSPNAAGRAPRKMLRSCSIASDDSLLMLVEWRVPRCSIAGHVSACRHGSIK